MIILIALISIVFGTSITSCQNINSDGTYYLANNLVSSGNCIIVNAQNVVIDGQGYSITSSGHGIVINVPSFNISIVNVNISSNQNNIYREGFVENSTITIYNSTLSSNGSNLLIRNETYSVNNLSIEIQNSTLNASNNDNIYFSINTSSNNTIRIVNSSMYANYSNIVPNNHSNGSVENLVIEILNSTLNASNANNIYFHNNKSSNNTMRIVNSSLYASSLYGNNIYFLSDSLNLNNTVQINDSILESNYTNIRFNDSNSSTDRNNTVIILRSNLSSNNTNFLLHSLNKTINDYNVLIVNTSLIGNVSFNLTEVTLNISAFNNLFLSNQHFVNSSSNISGILNISKTLGTSIIGTPYLGGNYWKGYSDLCPDFDGDGLCELPYVISSNAIDYLPLTNHTQHGTVLSENFSTNTTPVFNISINVSPSINYTIYLYINGTLYDSTSGSGAGNYSLGATLGSGNYTYWFVVNYTIGGFNYSYTYGNYSAYIDVNPPYVEIIDPKPLDYPSEPIVFLFNVSDDMNISCNFLLTRDATVVLNQSFSTSGLYNYTYSLVPGQYNLTLICSDGLNTNSTFVMFNSSNYSDPDRFNVTSENFSSNSSFNLFNVSVNVTGDYTIYLYINGTLYNSISGSGVGNYSLGATLGSGNYTYWFVVNYTIGGFNYSYTYGNYSVYVDIELPSISILWPVDGESYTRGNRIIQILVTDDLSSTLSCQLNVTGPDSFNDIFTISNGHVYNYSYNFNSLGLYTMNVSCNDGFNQNQTSITFRIRESGGLVEAAAIQLMDLMVI